MGENKLAEKRALVTGAGTGIGREIAIEFARQGADVVVHYSHAPEGAESAVKEIQALGRRASLFKADFIDPELPTLWPPTPWTILAELTP